MTVYRHRDPLPATAGTQPPACPSVSLVSTVTQHKTQAIIDCFMLHTFISHMIWLF